MTNDELATYDLRLCAFGGDCDYCHEEAANGDYFWMRTSHEYVEGDYYCRACAIKETQGIELFRQTGVPHYLVSAPLPS